MAILASRTPSTEALIGLALFREISKFLRPDELDRVALENVTISREKESVIVKISVQDRRQNGGS